MILNKKRTIIKGVLLFITSIIIVVLVYNNYSYYQKPIGQINKATTTGSHQVVTLTMKNTVWKGEKFTIDRTFDTSQVYDDKYKSGTLVFVSFQGQDDSDSQKPETLTISGVKRDYIAVAMILLIFDLLVLVGGKKGFYTTVGMCINTLLFIPTIFLYMKGYNVLVPSIFMCLIFSLVILLPISGFTMKTLISFLSTISVVGIIGLASALIIRLGPPTPYEFLEFLPEPFTAHTANMVFLSQILIGGLGAIMDISVTLTSVTTELLAKDKDIKLKALISSCYSVADDITGTMINVVVLTNIASIIPTFILSVSNGFDVKTLISNNLFFEVARALTGSIGIILTIPVTILAVTFFYKRRPAK